MGFRVRAAHLVRGQDRDRRARESTVSLIGTVPLRSLSQPSCWERDLIRLSGAVLCRSC
jgi:hypothetical protein